MYNFTVRPLLAIFKKAPPKKNSEAIPPWSPAPSMGLLMLFQEGTGYTCWDPLKLFTIALNPINANASSWMKATRG
jgi:hypothetical protein